MARSRKQPKPKVLPPVHPNKGIEAELRKTLDKLIAEMHKSVLYWLQAAYRKNPPELAQDASPAKTLQAAMKKLSKRWEDRFKDAAPKLASYYATKISKRVDGRLEKILGDAGFSIKFTMSKEMNDAMQATVGEQVGLIKSIAEHHLNEVEGLVMRSVTAGRDLKYLTDQLQKRYDITRRRAKFIARDQVEKATATITRVRQQSAGIKEAIWRHSGGGRHPREEHVRWGREKKTYDIAKGMWSEVDKERVWPGGPINCRCVSRAIVPGLNG